MEKIKSKDIKNTQEYRAIIPTDIGGTTVDLKVLNPKGEVFDHLYDVTADILENDVHVLEDGTEINEKRLLNYMINVLTNIETDLDEEFHLDDNVGFLEVISAIQDIHSEIIIKMHVNLNNFYLIEKQRFYANKMEKSYQSFLDVKENQTKEKNK